MVLHVSCGVTYVMWYDVWSDMWSDMRRALWRVVSHVSRGVTYGVICCMIHLSKYFFQLSERIISRFMALYNCTYYYNHSIFFQAYKEALDLGLRVVGENHPTIDRLYLNMAIHYEEIGNYDLAYAHFRKWYGVCCELYGRQHPKTRRPISTLTEPRYRRLAEQNGDDVPEMPSEDEPT